MSDYIRCVRNDTRLELTYCGQPAGRDWLFNGILHAKASQREGTYVQPCPRCMDAFDESRPNDLGALEYVDRLLRKGYEVDSFDVTPIIQTNAMRIVIELRREQGCVTTNSPH